MHHTTVSSSPYPTIPLPIFKPHDIYFPFPNMKSYSNPSYVQKEAIKLMNEYVNDRISPMSVRKAAAEVKQRNNKIPSDVGVSALRE